MYVLKKNVFLMRMGVRNRIEDRHYWGLGRGTGGNSRGDTETMQKIMCFLKFRGRFTDVRFIIMLHNSI